MYCKQPLFLFVENEDLPDEAKSIIAKVGVTFSLLNNIDDAFNKILINDNYVVFILHNKFLYDSVQQHIENINPSHFFILNYTPACSDAGFFNNYTYNNETLSQFLIRLIKNSYIDLTPVKSNLITKLIRHELEKIGILKNYVGFKYLTDLMEIALKNRNTSNIHSYENFKTISVINLVNIKTIERDIRHMVIKSWHNSPPLQELTMNLYGKNFKPVSKKILQALAIYLRSLL